MPARRASALRHGIGSDVAQLTLTVALSHWNRSRSRAQPAGQVAGADQRAVEVRGGYVGEHGTPGPDPLARRRAPTPSTAVSPSTTEVTGAAHRSTPPRLRSRSTSASVSRPEPPSGTGKPCSCPSIASSSPYSALPAASGDRSVCIALPATSSAAPSPRNSSPTKRRAGSTAVRASRRARAGPSRRAIDSAGRTGGNGCSSASSTGPFDLAPPRRPSRRHASPSPGAERVHAGRGLVQVAGEQHRRGRRRGRGPARPGRAPSAGRAPRAACRRRTGDAAASG